MGATPVPLKIGVIGLEVGEEFQKYQAQGHIVDELPELGDYDILVGPNCWRIRPGLLKFLPIAIKETRAAVKAARPKKSPAKKKASHT